MAPNGSDRLGSWKEIASFIGRDVRTARRWEKELGMPVHREPGTSQGRVYALRAEMEAWLASRDHKDLNGNAPLNESETQPADARIFNPARSSQYGTAGSPRTSELNSPSALPMPPLPLNPQSGIVPAPGAERQSRKWLWLAAAASIGMILWLADGRLVRSFSPGPPRILHFQQLTDDGREKANLRTDGVTLFYDQFEGERITLASVPVTGGPVHAIASPFANSRLDDVSANGKDLLVESNEGIEIERPLWAVPVAGGSPQRVGDILCHSAAWSPDGTKIAYANHSRIYLANADGSNPRLLSNLSGFAERLLWAPNGRRIRLTLRDPSSETFSPWELQVDGTAGQQTPRRVGLNPGRNCCGHWDWSRDGQYFLFVSHISAFAHLNELDSGDWNWPFARPQAREIPLGLSRIEGVAMGKGAQSVYLIGSHLDRGEFLRFDSRSAQFVPHLRAVSAEYLSYSRDGKWISYAKLPDTSLWRSRADGSEAVQLTTPPFTVQFSTWSPDGREIAYMAQAPGKPWRIYVVSRDGDNLREASSGNDQQGAPTWSPDGQRISYGKVLCQQTGTCVVRVIDAATGNAETLPGSQGLRTARWSPDGKYIAALQTDSHEVRLFETQQRRWFTIANSVFGDDMAWSRDSRYVYVNGPERESGVIIRIRLSDRKRETVVDASSLRRLHGGVKPWFVLAPDDSPVLFRRPDAGDIYALEWTDQ